VITASGWHQFCRAANPYSAADEAFVEACWTGSRFLLMPYCPHPPRLSSGVATNGTSVGPHDLIIAATAITKGYTVTTRDERSFPRIPGLTYQRW
jgi:hypothetical protein